MPGLLRDTFGGLVTVGPRPLWERALRVAAIVLIALFLAGMLVLVAGAFMSSNPSRSTTRPSGAQADVLEQRAHVACQQADAAFGAPPERLGLELGNAADTMRSAAQLDAAYGPATDALLWFRDHVVDGRFTATEAEAAPYFDIVAQACAAHLSDPTPSTAPAF